MRTPLQKGEKILLVTYTSRITLVSPAIITLISFIASYFIGFTTHWGWVVAAVGLVYFLIRYFSWRANIWVITNLRVIDETGLISHYAKESPLEKINNVSYDQTIWGRIFNYGHVEIQTAAQVGATDYYNVHHPKRLKDTITQAQSDLENNKITNQATQMANTLGLNRSATTQSSTGVAAELEQLYNLKQKGILSEEEYLKAKNKLLNN
ncbi:MAG TPA: PH domain-containing protein [Puia sp.]|nr:PH domain-containing protein [Puia sp.]